MKSLFVAFLAFLFCSCATPYKSSGIAGGYSDTALAPDVYRISFQGNGYTSKQRAQDFAVLRAADLTLSHGYRYFAVVNETEGGRSGTVNTPGYSYTTGSAVAVGNYAYGNAHTTYVPGASIPFYFPESGLVIRCFKERPEGIFAFDAAFVSHSLREKYQLKA
jgi:hypothetical protein